MVSVTAKITVITNDDRFHHHEYAYPDAEKAEEAVDVLFTQIMVAADNGSKTIVLSNPKIIYSVDKLVSIAAEIA